MRRLFSVNYLGAAVFTVVLMLNVSVGLNSYADFDVTLANIEAIAQNEDGSVTCNSPNCNGGLCHYFQNDDLCPCAFDGTNGSRCSF